MGGDVLEELRAEGVLSQGNGLIVTYLLEEDAGLPFVRHGEAGEGGRCSAEAVATWGAGREWGRGLEALPDVLHGEDCPAVVWEFLVRDE